MGEEQSSRAGRSRRWRSTPARPPDASTGAVVPPISLATTFAQREVGVHQGYEYSRSGNPTRTAVEQQIAALEAARHGLAFASGLAAEDNVLRLLRQGQRVLLGNDAYGGTFRLISKVWQPLGFPWTAVDLERHRRARRRLAGRHRHGVVGDAHQPAADVLRHRGRGGDRPRTRARWWSSTTRSPRRTCSSRSRSAPTSSCTRRPSTSAATATSSAGSSRVDDDELAERLRFTQNAAGAVPSPFDCYLVLRGAKTLAVRMDRHCQNARLGRRPADRSPGGRHACCTRSCPTIPDTPRRPSRCATTAGWCQLHAARRRGGGAAGGGGDRAVHARRVARRGREPDRAPGGDDARLGGGIAAGGARRI